MSLNGISSSSTAALQSTSSQSGISPMRQLKQDLDALGQALDSGDLSAAQSAFSTYQNDLKSLQPPPPPPSSSNSTTSSTSSGSSSLSDLLKTLQSALDSGNLSDAQSAFSNFLQALQTGFKSNGSSETSSGTSSSGISVTA